MKLILTLIASLLLVGCVSTSKSILLSPKVKRFADEAALPMAGKRAMPRRPSEVNPLDVSILSLQLSFSAPTNWFTGYEGLNTNEPSWVATPSYCWTVTLTFSGPAGVYEIWFKPVDIAPAQIFDNGGVGTAWVRTGDQIQHTADGVETVVFPIIPEPVCYFRLKRAQ